MIWIVLVLVAAGAVGTLAQRRLFGGREEGDTRTWAEGLRVKELVIPVRSLAALLLAFVVVSVFGSFRSAGDQAAAEAGAVLSMGEHAVLLTDSARVDMLGSLHCYARSVAGPDWSAQADDGALSPVTDAAADRITKALERAAADPRNASVTSAILSADETRIQARIERSNQGRPTVPNEVWALLLITVAVMIGGSSALTHPGVRRSVQYGLLAGTTVVFGLTLLITYDIDRPFDGLAKVAPTAMQNVDRRITALPGGEAAPPCDAEGRLR